MEAQDGYQKSVDKNQHKEERYKPDQQDERKLIALSHLFSAIDQHYVILIANDTIF